MERSHSSLCLLIRKKPVVVLGKVAGKGTGDGSQAPDDGHQPDAFLAAPAIHQYGKRQGKYQDGPVHRRNQKPELGIGKAPVLFDIRKQADHNQTVDVIERVQQEQQDKNEISRASGQFVRFGRGHDRQQPLSGRKPRG